MMRTRHVSCQLIAYNWCSTIAHVSVTATSPFTPSQQTRHVLSESCVRSRDLGPLSLRSLGKRGAEFKVKGRLEELRSCHVLCSYWIFTWQLMCHEIKWSITGSASYG